MKHVTLNYIIIQKISVELYRKICNKVVLTKPTNTKAKKLNLIYEKYPPNLNSMNCPNSSSHYMTWSHSSLNWNKIMHILMGNRRLGYRLAMWNCRKGLFLPDKSPSEKLEDIKHLLQHHDLHLLAVVESDLHGVSSRVKRANPLTTKDISEKLYVEGWLHDKITSVMANPWSS